MKKLLVLVGLLTGMYAIPPCEYQEEKICIYLYKGAMSSEVNLINMTDKKIIINAEVTLDGNMRSFKDWVVEPNQPFTMLKSRYDDHSQKPNFSYKNFSYKFIN